MTLVVVIRAKCVARVVAIAAISGIGEEPVRVLIVADKLVATRGSGQCAGLSAQAAASAFLLSLRFRLRSFRGAGLCYFLRMVRSQPRVARFEAEGNISKKSCRA